MHTHIPKQCGLNVHTITLGQQPAGIAPIACRLSGGERLRASALLNVRHMRSISVRASSRALAGMLPHAGPRPLAVPEEIGEGGAKVRNGLSAGALGNVVVHGRSALR